MLLLLLLLLLFWMLLLLSSSSSSSLQQLQRNDNNNNYGDDDDEEQHHFIEVYCQRVREQAHKPSYVYIYIYIHWDACVWSCVWLYEEARHILMTFARELSSFFLGVCVSLSCSPARHSIYLFDVFGFEFFFICMKNPMRSGAFTSGRAPNKK